jgi:hypothetical protein
MCECTDTWSGRFHQVDAWVSICVVHLFRNQTTCLHDVCLKAVGRHHIQKQTGGKYQPAIHTLSNLTLQAAASEGPPCTCGACLPGGLTTESWKPWKRRGHSYCMHQRVHSVRRQVIIACSLGRYIAQYSVRRSMAVFSKLSSSCMRCAKFAAVVTDVRSQQTRVLTAFAVHARVGRAAIRAHGAVAA